MPVEKELYDILEVSPECSAEEIKKAFRKKALQHHPDKGGDTEVFKKINSAYEILSDPEKRKVYDSSGKNGLKQNNIVPEDILRSMFGSMFAESGFFSEFENFGKMFSVFNKKTNKTQPSVYNYNTSLENICRGKEVKLKISRNVCCSCILNFTNCQECGGQGVKMVMSRFGPLISHNTVQCGNCSGHGKLYNYCGNCKNGEQTEDKVIVFNLNPEIENGHRFIFEGEGNQNRNSERGDFIVSVNYEDHPVFKVEGKNLIYTHNLSLKEALTGHLIKLEHPSGENLEITIKDVIDPETKLEIAGKGITSNSILIIKYKIIFPKEISNEAKKILKHIDF
jgi:DnaJ family protein A protein 2